MGKLTVYQYPRCGTCRKALKWLDEKGLEYESVHIVDHPPSEQQLRELIQKSGLPVKAFFNTSGQVCRELNLKEKLPQMNEEEQIRLLASNGKLMKRPIVTDGERVTVGFHEDQFADSWGG